MSSKKLSNQKKCYLCGGLDFNYRQGTVRDNSALRILECKNCGLVFLSSLHIEESFYKNSGMHGSVIPDVETLLRETQRDDLRRFSFLKEVLSNRTVLDFGCGAGGFLLKARSLAATVQGVELENRLKSHFQEHNLAVFSNLSEIPRDKKYNIITLFHVLEHLPDPKLILIELSNLMADNGQIIIEVPNADDALLTLYHSEPFSHFTYWSCHLFLFTAKTLSMLVLQSGLKVNYIKQDQRYPLSNHLYWLAKGKPGGHMYWHFLDTPDLHNAYEKQLAAIGKCDTLVMSISKK